MTEKISLGVGTLTWARSERISDRYGTVYLVPDGNNSLSVVPSRSLIKVDSGDLLKVGELLAVVKQTRRSTHIGDLFHGISPRTPEVGQIIVFGKGKLFCEPAPEGGDQVGVRPLDGRPDLWLEMRSLYDAHEQTVELFFHPET